MVQVQHKVHHSSVPYEVANKASADKARAKLEDKIADGKASMATLVQGLITNTPQDHLVKNGKLKFHVEQNGVITIDLPTDPVPVHSHAVYQMTDVAGIPRRYVEILQKEDPELLQYNLQNRYSKRAGEKNLARVVNGKVLGWLSDRYDRSDEGALMQSFIENAMELGAVPYEARDLTTKSSVKMLFPELFEPIENEILAFGVQFRNSGFGDGARDVSPFICRTWCTNDAMAESVYRSVHLGVRLDDTTTFSNKTYSLRTQTLQSVMKDILASTLDRKAIEARCQLISDAAAKQVPIKEVLEQMRKGGSISKAEVARTIEIMTTSDVEILPPVMGLPEEGKASLWRLANALSALAKEADGHRSIELESASGRMLGLRAAVAA